ncbi:MAG: hypothetical protein V4642_06210 [Bacteroidota bacterium]
MKRHITLRHWFFASALWLAAISLLGIAMRLSFVGQPVLKLPFQNVLHAHSHVAFFGWMGSGLMGLFYYFLKTDKEKLFKSNSFKKHETATFWLLQTFTLGAFIAFLAQGYALFSIIFSTLHIFLWYYFAWHIWPRFKNHTENISFLFLKTAVIFLLLSSLGTWALPPIMIKMPDSFLKRAAIDFFVHTFSDGWLVTASLGFLFAVSGVFKTSLPNGEKFLKINFALMIPAVLLSSLRSVLPDLPHALQIIVISAGVLLGILHLHTIWLFKSELHRTIFKVVFGFLFLKALMEISGALPGGAALMQNRFVIIAYLHIKLIGIASIALTGAMYAFKKPRVDFLKGEVLKTVVAEKLFIAGGILMSAALGAICLPAILPHEFLKDFAGSIVVYGQYGAIAAGGLILASGVKIMISMSDFPSGKFLKEKTSVNMDFGEKLM